MLGTAVGRRPLCRRVGGEGGVSNKQVQLLCEVLCTWCRLCGQEHRVTFVPL